MKVLIAALILSQQTGPTWNLEERMVPSPIPEDICVEVHYTEKSKRPGKIGIHLPPLDLEEREIMERMRRNGKARLKLCSLVDS